MAIGTALAIAGVAAAGATAYGARQSSRASTKAGETIAEASDQAAQLQNEQYQQARRDLAPARQTGNYAYQMLAQQLGIPTYDPNDKTFDDPGTPARQTNQYNPYNAGVATAGAWNIPGNASFSQGNFLQPDGNGGYTLGGNYGHADRYAQYEPGAAAGADDGNGVGRLASNEDDRYGAFYESPDYQFRRDESLKAASRAAAAGGYSASGRAVKEATRYAGDVASQEYGTWYNRVAGVAGAGQTATQASVNAGSQYASNAGNALIRAGDARASGIVGSANARSDAAGQLARLGGTIALSV